MAIERDPKPVEANPRNLIEVNSPNVRYTSDEIISNYTYETVNVQKAADGSVKATPVKRKYTFKVKKAPAKTGLMIVGWGGNNGTTVTAGIIANREGISWHTKAGKQEPDYLGSLTQAATVRLGATSEGEEVYVPFWRVLPMVNPNDLVMGGWDISSMNLADGMERGQVLDYDLQRRLVPYMKDMKPLPSIYSPDFIAANQEDRADNVLTGTMQEQCEQIRKDIRTFKSENSLDKVIVLWSANTERFSEVLPGVHDTADNILAAIRRGEKEIAPSVVFAVASILEGSSFINGSPQNTLHKGVIELASRHSVFVGGDDFKSGQTKMKSVLTDFLVSAGIKPRSIVSYNHLGNNDGKNLNSPKQFRSKEISKSNVVDDMVESNSIMYKPGEHPDHVVVIKYVPYVADSKRAMDEYTSQIFMGGTNTIVMHNTCEDSLLASPLILDLAITTELFERMSFKTEEMETFESFDSVLSFLSYFLKAPQTCEGMPIVNALGKQRSALENIFRACLSLPPENHLLLEHVSHCVKETHDLGSAVSAPAKNAKKHEIMNGANGDVNGVQAH